MVLGLRSKSRKGTSVQVDYIIHVQEIKPWPPSQSLKSAQSLLLQWENGDQGSGSFSSNAGDGKVEFGESFRLSATLWKEVSRKGTARDSFLKNYLEFKFYESRKDKAMKGQLLGSAVMNLADYGIITDAVTINAPINFKKPSRSTLPAVLYVNIQAFDRAKSSLSKEVSLDKDESETVSEVANEGNDNEIEIASFTDDDDDDDDDDDVSPHSSLTVSSSALESIGGSPGQSDKQTVAQEGSMRSLHTPPGVAPSNPDVNSASQGLKHPNGTASTSLPTDMPANLLNPVNNLAENNMLSDDCSQVKDSNCVSLEESRAEQDAGRKAWRHETSGPENPTTNDLNGDIMDEKNEVDDKEQGPGSVILEEKKPYLEEKLVGQLPEDASKNQARIKEQYSCTQQNSDWSAGCPFTQLKAMILSSIEILTEKPEKINVYENGSRVMNIGRREKSRKGFSDKEGESNSKVEIHEKELSGAAAEDDLSEQGDSTKKLQLMEKEKKIDLLEKINKGRTNRKKLSSETKLNCSEKSKSSEEELMRTAAVEVGLYSVVAEHGSSINKVLAPARRLSRFYLHACKAMPWIKRANAARAIISGLILVSKACGNDVPRLTFWLSNSIVLRAIVTQAAEKLQLAAVPSINNNGGPKGRHESFPSEAEKTDRTESSDKWAEPQPFIAALKKVEAWIFSRIVESVWWQTLTPHMQSTAVKSSNQGRPVLGGMDWVIKNRGISLLIYGRRLSGMHWRRLCPVRAGGHECGCLPVLSRLVMEQLVSSWTVAMFNAILRESAEEMPTDPVSDPISDPKVLPIPAGNSSFGAGAQLKNAIYSVLMIMTLQKRRMNLIAAGVNVCPAFGAPVIKRVLDNFVPDEFNPDPVPETILETMDSEDLADSGEGSITDFPCIAVPTIYSPPPAASLTKITGEVGGQTLQRSRSAMLRKSYNSDDELDELDSPMPSIIENSKVSPTSTAWNRIQNGKAARKVVRYQLLREAWKDGE
uniref:C2 NT-type domain-containing protein n=1 Tax=Salix viminalis TaxID=40686 RepID=A0A6N2MNJ5_SALVM